MIDPNQHDAFVVKQHYAPIVNRYDVETADGQSVAVVEQKRFAFKEELTFKAARGDADALMVIKARQRFDPSATYDVRDDTGATVGIVRKAFGASLLRSTWVLLRADETELCRARERKLWVALLRRLIGFVPYVGNFADWLPIPYDFVFSADEQELGVFRRRRGSFRDTYDLDLTLDTEHVLDRRLALATAVGLDALQAR